ncbi:hypothetical protein [Nostoc sp.]
MAAPTSSLRDATSATLSTSARTTNANQLGTGKTDNLRPERI